MKKSPVKTRNPEATTARLTKAAIDVVTENGWNGAGIVEIARRAGLSNGAIYANFSTKNDLLGAAIERHMTRLVDVLGSYELSSESKWDALIGLLRQGPIKSRMKAKDLPPGVLTNEFFAEAFAASPRNERLMEIVRTYMKEAAAQYGSLIEKALKEKGIDEEIDARALAWLICSCAVGTRLLSLIEHPTPDPDHWSSLIDHLFNGLAGGATPGRKTSTRTASRKTERANRKRNH